jgi:hypothetical protein
LPSNIDILLALKCEDSYGAGFWSGLAVGKIPGEKNKKKKAA